MKKLFIMALAVVGLTLASCGEKSKSGAATDSLAVDTTEAAAETEAAEITALSDQLKSGDASAVEKAITAVKEKYDELVAEGKVEEASKYASQIKAYVEEHAEEIKAAANGNATVAGIIDAVKNLPTTASTAVEGAASAVASDANAAKEAVKEGAETAVENAKAAGKAKVEEAKQKAADAVDKKVNEGVDKALKGVGLK